MYLLLKLEPRLVTYELHILVVNTKICGVPNLLKKALHFAWLTIGIDW
jgi:hypothetical protein